MSAMFESNFRKQLRTFIKNKNWIPFASASVSYCMSRQLYIPNQIANFSRIIQYEIALSVILLARLNTHLCCALYFR